MRPEVLCKLDAGCAFLPELYVAVGRAGDEKVHISSDHSMGHHVSVHVAALIHLC